MERHFEKELKHLRSLMEKMGNAVKESLHLSTRALLERDKDVAESAFQLERDINAMEMEIDHLVADFFALFQPVATDLRFLLAVQKINNDLERAGDHCVNIAQSAVTCASLAPAGPGLLDIPNMVTIARNMLSDALESFMSQNPKLARTVLETDDQIDELNRSMTRQVIQQVKNDPSSIEVGLELLRVSKNLERVADLSTNIAEEVIFHVQARVVKHHAGETPKSHPAGEAGKA